MQRLLSVRSFTDGDLQHALVGAVAGLPPSQRYDDVVPPTPVLSAWLDHVDERDHRLHRSADRSRWDAPRLRVDELLVDALMRDSGPADQGRLRQVLVDAGYTPASAKALVHTSPILQRVASVPVAIAVT